MKSVCVATQTFTVDENREDFITHKKRRKTNEVCMNEKDEVMKKWRKSWERMRERRKKG